MAHTPLAYYRTIIGPQDGLEPGDLLRVDYADSAGLRVEGVQKGTPDFCNAPLVLGTGERRVQPLVLPSSIEPDWQIPLRFQSLRPYLADLAGASKVIPLDHNFVGTTTNALYRLPAGSALDDVLPVDETRQAFVVHQGAEHLPGVVNLACPDGPIVCAAQVFDPSRRPLAEIRLDVKNAARLALVARRLEETPASCESTPVVFFTTSIGPWGGVIALTEMVTRLRQLGVNAHIVTCREHHHKVFFGVTPHKVRTTGYLGAYLRKTFGERGVLVATHWNSVEGVVPAKEVLPGWQVIAYWQDQEDLFVDTTGHPSVNATNARLYKSIAPRVLNASWLRESAEGDVIPVGYDPTVFNTTLRLPTTAETPVRVLAMYRPSTPRRGHKRLEETYRALRRKYGRSVRLTVFGEPAHHADWFDKHLGALSSAQVADAMRDADVYIEPSDFQGFGLPGIEALACGAFLLSTDNKGIHEYGVHEDNCLIDNDLVASFGVYYGKSVQDRVLQSLRCEFSVARFSWDNISEAWRDWLDMLPTI